MINTKQSDFHFAQIRLDAIEAMLKMSTDYKVPHYALDYIKVVRSALLNLGGEVSELKKDFDESVRNHDRLVSALLATDEARALHLADSRPVFAISIDEALKVIEAMSLKLREYKVLDDIPFGEAIPNVEMIEMQKRIADLEIQLETRTEQLTSLQLSTLNAISETTALIINQVRVPA